MDFPSIERLRVEYHGCRVPGLGTVDADFSSELHPGDGEDGAGVGTRQGEHVLLPVLQEPQHTSRERGGDGQAYRRERGSWGSEARETKQLPAKGTGLLALPRLAARLQVFMSCAPHCGPGTENTTVNKADPCLASRTDQKGGH